METPFSPLTETHNSTIGDYRTLSKDDIFEQTRELSNSTDSWQEVEIDSSCNNFIEEYE